MSWEIIEIVKKATKKFLKKHEVLCQNHTMNKDLT